MWSKVRKFAAWRSLKGEFRVNKLPLALPLPPNRPRDGWKKRFSLALRSAIRNNSSRGVSRTLGRLSTFLASYYKTNEHNSGALPFAFCKTTRIREWWTLWYPVHEVRPCTCASKQPMYNHIPVMQIFEANWNRTGNVGFSAEAGATGGFFVSSSAK